MTDKEFHRLATLYLENAIDQAELQLLNRELARSPERVQRFNDLRLLTGLIREHGWSAVESDADSCESDRESPTESLPVRSEPDRRFAPRFRDTRLKWIEHLSLMASVLICVGLGVLLWQRNIGDPGLGNSVARLEFVSADAEFGEGHVMPRQPGRLLEKGWVQLDRGVVRIVFHSGAHVELNGPAAFGLDTPLRSYLEFGRAQIHAPESARDFVVATESMEVVDLGTRFEIDVDRDSRESNVAVTEGLVDLHLGSRGAERMIQPLEAGYAARVDAIGRIVEITNGSDARSASATGEARILAHWTFDEAGADRKVWDSSGKQLDRILGTGKLPEFVPGVSGQALLFTDNACVDLHEHVATLAELDAFTFAAWVRDPGHPLAMLFSLSGDSEQHRVQFYLARRFVRFGWQDGLHYDSISGRVDRWNPGQWYHVAVAIEGGVARLYRDGELLASGSVGSKIGTPITTPAKVKNASHAYLGRLEDSRQGDEAAPQWFQGQMDDAQFYSGAVSQQGIQFLFEHPGARWSPGETHE